MTAETPPSSPSPAIAAKVETDYKKNKFFMYYFAFWGVVSVSLFVLSYTYGWGFWGWFGGGFALLVAAGGAGGMAKTGGAGVLACPACSGQIKVLHISTHRVERCEHCKTWLEGAETMSVCPPDRVSTTPVFRTYLPRTHRWPEGCVHCGAPATRELELESLASVGGKIAKVRVPFCQAHDGQSVLLSREVTGTFISFCSLAYCEAFKALNASAGSEHR